MITGFEKETHELNDYERTMLLPVVVKGLKAKVGKENVCTSTYICRVLIEKGYSITDARLRKIIHHIRAERLIVGLIATSAGYYVATNIEELEKYCQSLRERINSIQDVLNCANEDLQIMKESK